VLCIDEMTGVQALEHAVADHWGPGTPPWVPAAGMGVPPARQQLERQINEITERIATPVHLTRLQTLRPVDLDLGVQC
jgi:hypothetical protein